MTAPPLAWRALRGATALALALFLSACGGWWDDDPPAARLSGVAATGAPIADAVVRVVNAAGNAAIAITNRDGSYTVQIADRAPFMLSVVDAAGKTWYSYAAGAGTAHITPLTTLAMLQANASKPLADLMRAWPSAPLPDTSVLEAAKAVNANLRALMSAHGVDANSVNVFTASDFSASRTGLDAVLDALRVNLDCSPSACTQNITSPAGNLLVVWQGDIATSGITLSCNLAGGSAAAAGGSTVGAGSTATGSTSGTTGAAGGSTGSTTSGSVTVGLGSCKAPVAGTWSMIVQTTVSLGVAVPEICIDGLAGAPASQAEFCGSDSVKAQLPPGVEILGCRYSGDTGTIDARITTPVVVNYTVKYTFVKR